MPSAAVSSSTDLIVHPLRAKLDRFVTAWKSTDLSLQQALAPPSALQLTDEPMGATVLALVLAPIPVVSSGLLAQPAAARQHPEDAAPSAEEGEEAAPAQTRAKPLIVPFVVLKVLSPGWASVQQVAVGGSAAAGRGRGAARGGGKPPPAPIKGGVTPTGDRVRIARFGGAANEHLFVHSFESKSIVCPDGSTQQFRVAVTDDFMAISPGMHFVMRAWDNKVHQIFGTALDADIPPFSIARIEMTSKGKMTYNKNAMLDLRTVRLLTPNVSAAARGLVPPSLAFSSLSAAAVGKERFAIGTHILLGPQHGGEDGALVPSAAISEADVAQRLAAAGLHKLNQSYLSAHLGADTTLLCTVPTGGMFLIGADDALRYHAEDGGRLLDLPFGAFLVSLDERQFPYADKGRRDWLLRMLNILLQFRAIELLLAIDTYTPANGSGKERPQYAFARVHIDALTALFLRGPPVEPSALPDAVRKELASIYTGPDAFAGTLAAFTNGGGFYAVLDLNRIKRKQPPETSAGGMSSLVPRDAAWVLAHNLYFFRETQHIVQCMVSVQPAIQTGGGFLSAEEQKSRIFDAMPLLPALSPGAKRLRDDDEEEDDDEGEKAGRLALPAPPAKQEVIPPSSHARICGPV